MIGRGLCLALVFAAPALAVGQAQPAQKAQAIEEAPADRKICKKVEELGSRLGTKKVCKTAKQWEEQHRVQRENVEQMKIKD